MRLVFRFISPIAALACAALAALPSARAESWCAYPLWVHEWGVQVFGASGDAAPSALPSWFHRTPGTAGSPAPPVRHMEVDSGMRELPVVQLYSAGSLSDPIPVAIEVGFTRGEATAWYPQVDRRTSAASANGAAAQSARRALLAARSARRPGAAQSALGFDPTRQLEWSHLRLTREPMHRRARSSTRWVGQLRAIDRALWVSTQRESERFVFYEASTTERVALAIEVGAQHAAGRRHYVLRNRGSHTVHDVFVVHREGDALFVFEAPAIPAGASAGFVLEQHRVPTDRARAATRDALRARLVDAAEPAPPAHYRWNGGECVMQRDPAIPVEAAEGHRLYAAEVDAILAVWGARFFDGQGTTIVYREDTAYLDSVMPLSIYTDMYNFPLLRRAGLALWSDVTLPSGP